MAEGGVCPAGLSLAGRRGLPGAGRAQSQVWGEEVRVVNQVKGSRSPVNQVPGSGWAMKPGRGGGWGGGSKNERSGVRGGEKDSADRHGGRSGPQPSPRRRPQCRRGKPARLALAQSQEKPKVFVSFSPELWA